MRAYSRLNAPLARSRANPLSVPPSKLFVPCQQIVHTYSNIVVLYSETNCARRSKDGRQPCLARERERERLTFELHESFTLLRAPFHIFHSPFAYSVRVSLLLSVSWPSSSMVFYFYTFSRLLRVPTNFIYYYCCLLCAAYLIFNLLSFMIIHSAFLAFRPSPKLTNWLLFLFAG